jgi:hypothetical protein
VSTAKRKTLWVGNEQIPTKEGSLEYELGGVEGDGEVMSDTDFEGIETKTVPGRIKGKVPITKKTRPLISKLWGNPNKLHEVTVEEPDLGGGGAWTGMHQKLTYKVDSDGCAELEFVGPPGEPVE